MKTRDLEKLLLHGIKENLVGFTTKMSDLTLNRKSKNQVDIMQLLVHVYGGYWQVTPHIYIRNREIEEYYDRLTNSTIDFVTIGGELSVLMTKQLNPSEPIKYNIATESQLNYCISDISQKMNSFGEEYFEKYNNLSALDKILNDQPELRSIHMIVNPTRCIRGLIVAKLINNPKIENLIHIYSQKMEDVNPESQTEFSKVLQWIRNS